MVGELIAALQGHDHAAQVMLTDGSGARWSRPVGPDRPRRPRRPLVRSNHNPDPGLAAQDLRRVNERLDADAVTSLLGTDYPLNGGKVDG